MNKSHQMALVRNKDTAPEMQVRALLARGGVRYRLQRRDLPGTPDIYIPRLKLAIFVNGCFWHGHECPRGKRPATNQEFWNDKIDKNKRRDAQVREELRQSGINEITLWTCEMGSFDSVCQGLMNRYRGAKM